MFKITNDKVNELELTDKKIEALEEQLANLYNIKRKNSLILKKSITTHENDPWIDWKSRSPEKPHRSILKSNTNNRTKHVKTKVNDT